MTASRPTYRGSKNDRLEKLYDDWYGQNGCQRCDLHETRRNIVFGVGDADADIVFVGTAPGGEEDKEGLPMIGPTGDAYDELLEMGGLTREEINTVNMVGCRPFNVIWDKRFEQERDEQRDPSKFERDACRELLYEAIRIIDPIIIVGMGKLTCQTMLRLGDISIQKIQGEIRRFTLPGKVMPITYAFMPMLQPAFLARNGDQSLRGPWIRSKITIRRVVWFVDQLNKHYYGINLPDRGFTRADLFLP